MGIRCALFTDIAKDGRNGGRKRLRNGAHAKETELNIIASGGISSMKDLENLEEAGVYGAVLGKAIYSGAIDLKEAVRRFPQPDGLEAFGKGEESACKAHHPLPGYR